VTTPFDMYRSRMDSGRMTTNILEGYSHTLREQYCGRLLGYTRRRRCGLQRRLVEAFGLSSRAELLATVPGIFICKGNTATIGFRFTRVVVSRTDPFGWCCSWFL
jgi:hypothetical protein